MTAAAATTPVPVHDQPLPDPLVRATRHPLRWVKNKLVLGLDAVVLAHIGMLIIVAVYYLAFEINPAANAWWHSAVPDSNLRHAIRNVGEGVLGGFLAQGIVWNHYKRSAKKAGRLLRWLENHAHVPDKPLAIFLALFWGAIAFTIMYYLLNAFHVHASDGAPHGSFLDRTSTIWTSAWDAKIMGFVAAFAGRRPLRVVYDDVQLWFVQRRVVREQFGLTKGLRFYHPPTFKARFNDLKDRYYAGQTQLPAEAGHNTVASGLTAGALLVAIGLAGFGEYVLTYIA